MMRQVADAFAEYEKARLVSKLRHAHERGARPTIGYCTTSMSSIVQLLSNIAFSGP